MGNGRKFVAAAAIAPCLLLARLATAQVCFPPAGGVPGPGGAGAPNWWTSGAVPVGSSTSSFLDDPRWRGAASNGDLDYARFRVLVDSSGGTDALVMSWEVNADLTGAGDDLYFGLWDDTSATGNVYRLTRNTTNQTATNGASFSPDNAFAGRVFSSAGALGAVTWSGTSAGPPYPLPTWLTNDTRVDVSCATPPRTDCDRWAFRIRAPIDPAAVTTSATPTGLKISKTGSVYGTFRFWYALQDNTALGVASQYSMPTGLSPATETGGIPPIQFPDPNGWKRAQIGTGPTCDGDIVFDPSQVYVNSVGSTTLNLTSNTFHATPKNNVPTATRPSIPDASLNARFRIANWGSATFASPQWQDACSSTAGTGTVASGSLFDLSCTWTGFDSCPYKPHGDPCGTEAGTKDPHQCVLVDLGLPSGSTDHFFFSPQSVFQNMNFDVNSKLVRHATVDIRGLSPAPGGAPQRDVYLYVHTRNLPPRLEPAPSPDQGGQREPGDGGKLPSSAVIRARFPELQLPAEGPIGTKESARIQAAVQAGQLTYAQVEQLMPTYIVYVWTDNGQSVDGAGGRKKLLQPQPSFGLFLAHDGTLNGWKHQLAASGAVEIARNLFKISAHNDSTFGVTTTIEPIDDSVAPPGHGGGGGGRWIGLFLLLVLLLLFILRLKLKKATP